eukprot:1161295-Pelagomonas_calceolata.AAC.16
MAQALGAAAASGGRGTRSWQLWDAAGSGGRGTRSWRSWDAAPIRGRGKHSSNGQGTAVMGEQQQMGSSSHALVQKDDKVRFSCNSLWHTCTHTLCAPSLASTMAMMMPSSMRPTHTHI